MNGEVQILQTEPVSFPLAIESEIAAEEKSIEKNNVSVSSADVNVSNVNVLKIQMRFARLKKHLRKRSVSIL